MNLCLAHISNGNCIKGVEIKNKKNLITKKKNGGIQEEKQKWCSWSQRKKPEGRDNAFWARRRQRSKIELELWALFGAREEEEHMSKGPH